jgi:hypothetical protein
MILRPNLFCSTLHNPSPCSRRLLHVLRADRSFLISVQYIFPIYLVKDCLDHLDQLDIASISAGQRERPPWTAVGPPLDLGALPTETKRSRNAMRGLNAITFQTGLYGETTAEVLAMV